MADNDDAAPPAERVQIVIVPDHLIKHLSADATVENVCLITRCTFDLKKDASIITLVRYETDRGSYRYQVYRTYDLHRWLRKNNYTDPLYRATTWYAEQLIALQKRIDRSGKPHQLWAVFAFNVVMGGGALLIALLAFVLLLGVALLNQTSRQLLAWAQTVHEYTAERDVFYWPNNLWVLVRDVEQWLGDTLLQPLFRYGGHDVAALLEHVSNPRECQFPPIQTHFRSSKDRDSLVLQNTLLFAAATAIQNIQPPPPHQD